MRGDVDLDDHDDHDFVDHEDHDNDDDDLFESDNYVDVAHGVFLTTKKFKTEEKATEDTKSCFGLPINNRNDNNDNKEVNN